MIGLDVADQSGHPRVRGRAQAEAAAASAAGARAIRDAAASRAAGVRLVARQQTATADRDREYLRASHQGYEQGLPHVQRRPTGPHK